MRLIVGEQLARNGYGFVGRCANIGLVECSVYHKQCKENERYIVFNDWGVHCFARGRYLKNNNLLLSHAGPSFNWNDIQITANGEVIGITEIG